MDLSSIHMLDWVVFFLVVVIIFITWRYLHLHKTIDKRAHALYEDWRSCAMEGDVRKRADLLHREWTLQEEIRIRRDAIGKSEAVIRGKVTEHLTPYFPEFPFDPRDARFLGTPVDLIVFDGLSSGSLSRIVFLEVKTGKKGALSVREKQVRECIGERLVYYEVLHMRRDE